MHGITDYDHWRLHRRELLRTAAEARLAKQARKGARAPTEASRHGPSDVPGHLSVLSNEGVKR
jgi:hypothetical protein